MNDNKNIDQLKNQGWEDMSTLLDTHMPEEKIRPVIWWYWLAGAAALLLAVTIPLILLMNDNSPDSSLLMSQDQVITHEKEKTPNAEDKMELNKSPASSDETNVTGSQKGQDNLVGQERAFRSSDVNGTNRMDENKEVSGHPNSDGDEHDVAGTQKSNSNLVNDKIVKENLVQPLPNQEVVNLRHISFQVEKTGLSLEHFLFHEPKTIKAPESTGKISASVFAETMWSFSDHFGFVNAGPAIHYTIGKWAMGLSAGLALPLPSQKSFYASNLIFSNQYYFNSARQESFDMASPGLSASQIGSVYYEKYSTNPGLVLNLSAQRQLTSRWGIGIDVGYIGFYYDFTQKAEPNPDFRANTDLSNLKNNLWYGGLSVNYQMGEHWSLHGCVRLLNVLNAGDVGVLPAVRMEYEF